MPFELLKKEIVYSGRAFTIRHDTLRLPDGHETRFDIVEHVGSVIIIPLDGQDNLLFVRQYRHAAGLDLLELPAGTLNKDEAPDACAHREIREETGMAAGHMQLLGGFYLAPGYSTEYMHVYLATDLRPDPLEADADEFITVEIYPAGQGNGNRPGRGNPGRQIAGGIAVSAICSRKVELLSIRKLQMNRIMRVCGYAAHSHNATSS